MESSESYLKYFGDSGQDPRSEGTVYAAGTRVYDMAVAETGEEETVFLGTNKGVYNFRLEE